MARFVLLLSVGRQGALASFQCSGQVFREMCLGRILFVKHLLARRRAEPEGADECTRATSIAMVFTPQERLHQ